MLAAVTNLIAYQGADFTNTFYVTNDNGSSFDLTGFTAAGKIKKHYTSNTSTDFGVLIVSPLTAGAITISLDNATTAAMTPGKYVYDIVVTSAQNVKSRILEGVITIVEGVTL